ncbi:unnamed protein product [Caenorhabditis angaria]|uniref:C2H2-type domain-containing protein n=1 Tax=Caenorhabditis angaria TaxID=860376 RepID=A0A9P1IJH7_9PELO|nr:unnamed protein product [Caenorhabditis angaria]
MEEQFENTPAALSLLKCGKCDRLFFTERSLRSHSKVHVEKTMECRFCELKFNRIDILSAHLQMHFFTDLTFFACTIDSCDFSSDCVKSFEKHMTLSHSVEQLKCEDCDGEFINHRKFFTHKILCHGELKDYWKEMIESKKTRKRKINHNEEEEEAEAEQEQEFPESLRNVLTPSNSETSSEMLQKISEFLSTLFPLENGETFYKCAHCAIGFQDAILWMNHLQFHDQMEPMKCASCERIFENRQAFVIHLTYFQHDRFSGGV